MFCGRNPRRLYSGKALPGIQTMTFLLWCRGGTLFWEASQWTSLRVWMQTMEALSDTCWAALFLLHHKLLPWPTGLRYKTEGAAKGQNSGIVNGPATTKGLWWVQYIPGSHEQRRGSLGRWSVEPDSREQLVMGHQVKGCVLTPDHTTPQTPFRPGHLWSLRTISGRTKKTEFKIITLDWLVSMYCFYFDTWVLSSFHFTVS